MKLRDFINKCYIYIKLKKKLPRRKMSFKFLYLDEKIRSHICGIGSRRLYIQYNHDIIPLNNNGRLESSMLVEVYPKAPFFKLFYEYTIVLCNRERAGFTFDELNLYGTSLYDVFNMFKKQKEYITNVLRKNKYYRLNARIMNRRIPLAAFNNETSSKYILGCQPDILRLLSYGVEYINRYKRHLDMDIDASLVDIGDELIHLVKNSQCINDEFIVNRDVNKYSYEEAKKLLDAMCVEYDGEGLDVKDNCYIWYIGNEYLDEGDVKIFSSVYVYLSAYIKTFYVKVHLETFVNNKNLSHFCVKSSIFGEEAQILLGKTTNMFYNAIESLEAIGYHRQKILNYKLPVQIANTLDCKELEIGEILFALKPDEYSYIDKVEKI